MLLLTVLFQGKFIFFFSWFHNWNLYSLPLLADVDSEKSGGVDDPIGQVDDLIHLCAHLADTLRDELEDVEDVGPGDVWQHDGVLAPGPGAAGHAVHQAGDQAAVQPEEDGPGDHVPVGAVEHDVAVRILAQLQGVSEKSVVSCKLHC